MKIYGAIFLLSTLAIFADESPSHQEEAGVETIDLKEISHEMAYADETVASIFSSKKAKSNSSHSDKKAPVNQPSCRDYSERIQIGGNYSYAWIKPRHNRKTKGNLGGARAIYEHRPHDSIYAAAAFSWRTGTTKNDTTRRKIQDYNAQERVGYTFGKKCIGDNRLTLFTGIGLRYLAEKVIVHSASLKMDYTEFYIPVGFLFENKVNSLFSWGCNFEWMPQVFPLVRLQPMGGAQWGLKYKTGNFFVELPLTFSWCCDRYSFVIAPFFESWHDGHTTAKTRTGLALDLPSNHYLFAGVNASFGFSF